jgi:hypothetical protein
MPTVFRCYTKDDNPYDFARRRGLPTTMPPTSKPHDQTHALLCAITTYLSPPRQRAKANGRKSLICYQTSLGLVTFMTVGAGLRRELELRGDLMSMRVRTGKMMWKRKRGVRIR